MSNFTSIITTNNTNGTDEYLLRQGSSDRKMTRSVLSSGVAQDLRAGTDLDADETDKGLVVYATGQEVIDGVETSKVVSPATLAGKTTSTTEQGFIQLATTTEVITGADNTKAVTPLGLAARTSTTSRRGIVELATNTETQTGTSSSLAVTPAGLTARTATTSRTGIAELATQSEVNSGTSTTRIVTPSTLRNRTNPLYTSLAGSVTSGGTVTLNSDWDNFDDIVIVFGQDSGIRYVHSIFCVPLIIASDSTSTFRHSLVSDTGTSTSFNFRNTNRGQLYFASNTGDDDRVNSIYGRIFV